MFTYDKFSFRVLYFYSLIHTALQFFNSTENSFICYKRTMLRIRVVSLIFHSDCRVSESTNESLVFCSLYYPSEGLIAVYTRLGSHLLLKIANKIRYACPLPA